MDPQFTILLHGHRKNLYGSLGNIWAPDEEVVVPDDKKTKKKQKSDIPIGIYQNIENKSICFDLDSCCFVGILGMVKFLKLSKRGLDFLLFHQHLGNG